MGQKVWIPGRDPQFRTPPEFRMELVYEPEKNKAMMNIHAFNQMSKKHLGSIDFSWDLIQLEALIGKLEGIREQMRGKEKNEEPVKPKGEPDGDNP